jgi:single-stranded-DNA-specific exonuclease
MKYNLIQPNPKQTTDFDNIQNTILLNRGIEQPEHYLNTTQKDLISYSKLSNIYDGIELLNLAISSSLGIGVIVDADCDGLCSASMFYSYMKQAFNKECVYYIHTGKQHGISDEILPQIIKDVESGKIKLLVVPDAGTNDVDQCRKLKSLGCEILIIDHHEREKENKYSCIINPQLSDYDNKYLSGCGVTWKFLQAVDSDGWTTYADKYVDLVAFSTISDSMDIRTLENKELLRQGLLNVNNKLLKALIEKQDYSIKSEVTPTTIAFYIVPLINALVRVGSAEDKELMFKAFCELDEFFDYEKRDKSIVQESIYERVARIAVNGKAKQDRQIEKGIEVVKQDIEANKRNNNKILFAKATDDLPKEFTGLVAMKLASAYNKPCVLLREGKNDYFSGSLRNFSGSPLTDMKGFLKSLGYVQWLAGHPNACGVGLTKKQLIKTIELSNEKLKTYDFTPIYQIDFELTPDDLTTYLLRDLYEMRHHYGQQIPEALLLIKNIKLNSSQIQFLGKGEEKNTWKFPLTSEIDAIKFRIDKSDILLVKCGGELSGWGGEDIEMNIICKVGMNTFNGESKYQLIVQDYEICE